MTLLRDWLWIALILTIIVLFLIPPADAKLPGCTKIFSKTETASQLVTYMRFESQAGYYFDGKYLEIVFYGDWGRDPEDNHRIVTRGGRFMDKMAERYIKTGGLYHMNYYVNGVLRDGNCE